MLVSRQCRRLLQLRLLLGQLLTQIQHVSRCHMQSGLAFVRTASLQGQTCEESSEVIVVILGVSLERMIVAAGTADAGAEERLGHRVSDVGFFGGLLADGHNVVAHGRVF